MNNDYQAIICPTCKANARVPLSKINAVVRCNKCKNVFRASDAKRPHADESKTIDRHVKQSSPPMTSPQSPPQRKNNPTSKTPFEGYKQPTMPKQGSTPPKTDTRQTGEERKTSAEKSPKALTESPALNPVSVLLNTLVTDRLSVLYQDVQQGRLSENDFRITGATLLGQLQQAVRFLEPKVAESQQSHSEGVKQDVSAKQKKGVEAASEVKVRNAREDRSGASRKQIAALHPHQNLSPNSPANVGGSGVGGVAKLAGAALLGGAFGYLLSSQARSYPNHGYGGHLQEGNVLGNGGADYLHSGYGTSDSSFVEGDPTVLGFDTTNDGRPDTFVADTNDDGMADFRATDVDGDGLIDSFESDNDYDGDFDQKFIAENQSTELAQLESSSGLSDEIEFDDSDDGYSDDPDEDIESEQWDSESAIESEGFETSDDVADFDGGDLDFGDFDLG